MFLIDYSFRFGLIKGIKKDRKTPPAFRRRCYLGICAQLYPNLIDVVSKLVPLLFNADIFMRPLYYDSPQGNIKPEFVYIFQFAAA